ncbi:MAG: ribosome biogenesis GTPase Der [Deltaproteobacteria bacterium]|nr:ribosome biogenesis GTPase Der [Deltaproteobacteria bacterium]
MKYSQVAIIGRPNVGKSTLFNRIVKRRSAIVSPEAGVTRDRHDALVFGKTKKFQLIDTGGLEPTILSELDRLMQEQVHIALQQSHLLLYVMDGTQGLHPVDKDFIRELRKMSKNILLVINKMDDPLHEDRIIDYYELGEDVFYPISAEHKLGLEALVDAIEGALPPIEPSQSDEAIQEEIKIAIVGRPNVGKSTLTNKLLGQNRCIVSNEPLTTRDSIDVPIVRDNILFSFVDTAGIRKPARVNKSLEFYATHRSRMAMKRADVAFLVVDGDKGIVEQDLKIAHMAMDEGTSLVFIVNKWDLVTKDSKTSVQFERDFRDFYPQFFWSPMIFLSALSGQRVIKLFKIAQDLYVARKRLLSTSELGLFVESRVQRVPPPLYRGKLPKITKLSQMEVSPPKFYFKTNPRDSLKDPYKKYLINELYREYQFTGAPIQVLFS